MRAHQLVSVGAFLAVVGCTDNADRITGVPSQLSAPSSIEAAVRKLGFSPAGMIDQGDIVIVEGDVVLHKEGLLGLAERAVRSVDTTKGLRPNQPRLQWVVDTLVSWSNVSNIRVDLSQISSSPDWLDAVRAAMSNWNAVPGTRIFFTETTPADLSFTFADLRPYGTGVIAASDFPTGSPGRVGSVIRINIYSPGLSASQKTYNMTHEMGHSIGFRHTNWQAYDCGPYHITEHQYEGTARGANLVRGTPSTDANSVMNGCSGDRSWTGFSGYDQIAASNLYPPVVTLSESNNGGYPLVYAEATRGPATLDLKIEYKHTEWYDNIQQFQTFSYDEVVGTVGSGSSTPINHTWGSAYCSDWADAPYPQDESNYVLTVTYPQGTQFLGVAPAHVMDYSNSPWYQCS